MKVHSADFDFPLRRKLVEMCDRLWGLICVRRARRDTISGGGRMPRCSDGPSQPWLPNNLAEDYFPRYLPKVLAQWVVPCLDPQARWGPCLGSTQLTTEVDGRAPPQVSWKVCVTLWQETPHKLRQNLNI